MVDCIVVIEEHAATRQCVVDVCGDHFSNAQTCDYENMQQFFNCFDSITKQGAVVIIIANHHATEESVTCMTHFLEEQSISAEIILMSTFQHAKEKARNLGISFVQKCCIDEQLPEIIGGM